MEENLGQIAPPMPVADVCTPPKNTVWYAFKNWPNQFPDPAGRNDTEGLITQDFQATCPVPKFLSELDNPVWWFQSFWNMLTRGSPGEYAKVDPYAKVNMTCGHWRVRF